MIKYRSPTRLPETSQRPPVTETSADPDAPDAPDVQSADIHGPLAGLRTAAPPDGEAVSIPLLRRDGSVAATTLVDAVDAARARKHTWRLSSHGYAVRSETRAGQKCTEYLHRVIANPPAVLATDHINGDRLDNRRSNLRVATGSENGANSTDRTRQGRYRGVYLHKPTGRWLAQISEGGRLRHLGIFDTPELAAAAYDTAAARTWGEYAKLNLA